MKIQWTSKASSDLVRLHEHLGPFAPEAAARVVQLDPATENVLSSMFVTRYTFHSSTNDIAFVPGSCSMASPVLRSSPICW